MRRLNGMQIFGSLETNLFILRLGGTELGPAATLAPQGVAGCRAAAMRSTGMIRKIDGLGRVVLPIELRRALEIHEGDALEISVAEDAIVLRKAARACTFCGSHDDLIPFREKHICARCKEELSRA